jgi:hypothetical protein
VKSINRRTYYTVKETRSFFSIYRNAAQLWRITYFLDTIQSFITALICSPEQPPTNNNDQGRRNHEIANQPLKRRQATKRTSWHIREHTRNNFDFKKTKLMSAAQVEDNLRGWEPIWVWAVWRRHKIKMDLYFKYNW